MGHRKHTQQFTAIPKSRQSICDTQPSVGERTNPSHNDSRLEARARLPSSQCSDGPRQHCHTSERCLSNAMTAGSCSLQPAVRHQRRADAGAMRHRHRLVTLTPNALVSCHRCGKSDIVGACVTQLNTHAPKAAVLLETAYRYRTWRVCNYTGAKSGRVPSGR